MSEFAVRVENLSKQFRIGSREPYHRLSEALQSAAGQMFRVAIRSAQSLKTSAANSEPAPSLFSALDGVTFDLQPAEVVGVVGRNGAGKSTLLKILSRITPPTKGRVAIRGRVGSLLEVGTGFHPELTGRENIYLNGAILGMRRRDVQRKFDEIVAFAEVERFLDTPVKRYSSGMYMRLAFAVAAHLEPDILVVDEVLAVGDASFQKKCLGRMEGAARAGQTVLFVSHNLDAVRQLTGRVILLEHGRLAADGPTTEVLPKYLSLLQTAGRIDQSNRTDRANRTSGAAVFTQVDARDPGGASRWLYESGESVELQFSYRVEQNIEGLSFYLALRAGLSSEPLTTFHQVISTDPLAAGASDTIRLTLESLSLRPGDYSLYVILGDAEFKVFFDVIDENVNLSWLTITSAETNPYLTRGLVSLPHRFAADCRQFPVSRSAKMESNAENRESIPAKSCLE